MTLSDVEGHFCSYDWQSASRGPSESAELLVHSRYPSGEINALICLQSVASGGVFTGVSASDHLLKSFEKCEL